MSDPCWIHIEIVMDLCFIHVGFILGSCCLHLEFVLFCIYLNSCMIHSLIHSLIMLIWINVDNWQCLID